jgi:hypothetical protein
LEFRFDQSGVAVHLDDQIAEWADVYQSSMLDAHELLNLAAALESFPWDGRAFVVEIGAYLGSTTVFMAKVLKRLGKGVTILSIDPFERFQPNAFNPQGSYSAYLANIVSNQLDDVCLPLAACSFHAAHLIANDIGVLVIDGDHSYPAVSRDLALYTPKVRPGGFMFVDDYGPVYPDVMRAVDEFFASSGDFAVHAKSYFVVAQRTAGRTETPE